MSIEFWGIQDSGLEDHTARIQNLLNQGWQITNQFVQHVTSQDMGQTLYTTYLQRDTAAATAPKNGVYLASLMEVLEKRVAEVVAIQQRHTDWLTKLGLSVDVLEATADTDEVPVESIPHFNPFGTLLGFVESRDELPRTWQFIPTDHIGLYADVMREADAEDVAREGANS